jgi:hypothetical protein
MPALKNGLSRQADRRCIFPFLSKNLQLNNDNQLLNGVLEFSRFSGFCPFSSFQDQDAVTFPSASPADMRKSE